MYTKKILPISINLQLFAEGSGTGEGSGETGAAAVSQKGDTSAVKYGIQEGAQAANVQTQITDTDGNTATTIDRNAEFEKLIKGEYKDLYNQRVQDTVQKRLKGTKETVDKYNALTPMLEMLSEKYGVESTDADALIKAIEEDNSFYEEEALEKGITVEELKASKKMKRENAALKRELEQQRAKENADKTVAGWLRDAEQVKAIYPSFDFDAEMQNSKFRDLLRVPGVDVRTAYELTHKDDIIAGAMQFTAKAVEKKIADKIIANGARPTENGMNSQSAAVVKSDVSQLSKEDIREIQRRVARGEKISFG